MVHHQNGSGTPTPCHGGAAHLCGKLPKQSDLLAGVPASHSARQSRDYTPCLHDRLSRTVGQPECHYRPHHPLQTLQTGLRETQSHGFPAAHGSTVHHTVRFGHTLAAPTNTLDLHSRATNACRILGAGSSSPRAAHPQSPAHSPHFPGIYTAQSTLRRFSPSQRGSTAP